MIKTINREELQSLIATSDVQIIDVLPEREYRESHIPGAINVPLKELAAETVQGLRREKPTVVY